MNSIVTALKKKQDEAVKSGQWKLEELCKMAALEIETKAATIARLTAGSEAMQRDAANNTITIKMLMAQLAERDKEVSQLKEKVRYAYVQIEALERVK